MADHPLERKSADENDPVESLREIVRETQRRMVEYLDEGFLDPGKVVRPDAVRVTVVSGGRSSWLQEVGGSHVRNELEAVAVESNLEIIYYVPLPPAVDQVRPRQSAIAFSDLIHIGVFVGSAAGGWSVGKVLDQVQKIASNAWKRHEQYSIPCSSNGFWFVVSIWNSSDRYWTIIALDINSSLPDYASSVLPAYNAVMRFKGRRVHKEQAAHGDDATQAKAVLVTVRDGRVSRCRVLPNIEEAIGRLGNVHVVSSGGPLEALWAVRHPRSSIGLKVCQTLQEYPGRCYTLKNLAIISSCSVTTAKTVVTELASLGAPIYRQPTFEWVFSPTILGPKTSLASRTFCLKGRRFIKASIRSKARPGIGVCGAVVLLDSGRWGVGVPSIVCDMHPTSLMAITQHLYPSLAIVAFKPSYCRMQITPTPVKVSFERVSGNNKVVYDSGHMMKHIVLDSKAP